MIASWSRTFWFKKLTSGACAAVLALAAGAAGAAEVSDTDALKVDIKKTRSIAYTITYVNWALQFTEEGKECPNGFNDGPREHFKILFPEDGTKRGYVETATQREIAGWYPDQFKEPFPFKFAGGPVAPGMNLDGKVDADDFTNLEGEKGIDNQFYRGIGCIESYRGKDAFNNFWDIRQLLEGTHNRMLFEITDVDSLENDPDVTVTMSRGLHLLLRDAAGTTIGFKGIPGGTQRIDTRWGKKYIQTYKGKIENGVLITEPGTYVFPWQTFDSATELKVLAMRTQLKLTPEFAEGLLGGYLDFTSFHRRKLRNESLHHQSYGRNPSALLYQNLQKIADGPVNPETGKRDSVSSALVTRWAQVFVIRPEEQRPVAEAPAASRNAVSGQ